MKYAAAIALVLVPLLAWGAVPDVVRESTYDWRCINLTTGVFTDHASPGVAYSDCMKRKESDAGSTYRVIGGTYRIGDDATTPPTEQVLPATAGPVLSVSSNNTYFRRNGNPFYWVADTGWLMGWSLTNAQITAYLQDRFAKGVRVIHGPIIGLNLVLPPFDGGADDPFIDSVPLRLNASWWAKTDHAVKEAGRLSMNITLAPVWGSDNDRIFTDPARHVEFATLIAKRYANQAHVIYIAAGEYDKITDDVYVTNNRALNAAEKARYNAITAALRANAHPASLIVYHPDGWHQPSIDFGQDARVQFNMLQSGISLHENIRRVPIERDSVLKKPVVEAELAYENATNNAWKQRVPAYHTLMQGGAGFTYGNDLIWRFAAG